jgi:zinc protease
LLRELNDINGDRPVRDSELKRVIAGATRELPGRFETARAMLDSMVRSARYHRPLDDASTLERRYTSLKLDDLQRAAATSVNPNALVWVIVGDLTRIRSQIEDLGIAPIEIRDDTGNARTTGGTPAGGDGRDRVRD